MVELGEAQILEGQIAQTVERIVDCRAPLAHVLEQNLDLSAIHQLFSLPEAA